MIISSSLKNIYIHCDLIDVRMRFRKDLEILKAMTDGEEMSKFIKYLYHKYTNESVKDLIKKMAMCKSISELLNYVEKMYNYVGTISL